MERIQWIGRTIQERVPQATKISLRESRNLTQGEKKRFKKYVWEKGIPEKPFKEERT
jgi:hypothetical protein